MYFPVESSKAIKGKGNTTSINKYFLESLFSLFACRSQTIPNGTETKKPLEMHSQVDERISKGFFMTVIQSLYSSYLSTIKRLICPAGT